MALEFGERVCGDPSGEGVRWGRRINQGHEESLGLGSIATS